MDMIISFITAHPAAVAFGAFVGLIVACAMFQQFVRPMLIPKSKITEEAERLIQQYGPEAEHYAHIEEDRAWRYSDLYAQGKWRRVRLELQRRSDLGG